MSIEHGHAWLLSLSIAWLLAAVAAGMGGSNLNREARAAANAKQEAHNLEVALAKCRGSPEQEREWGKKTLIV